MKESFDSTLNIGESLSCQLSTHLSLYASACLKYFVVVVFWTAQINTLFSGTAPSLWCVSVSFDRYRYIELIT